MDIGASHTLAEVWTGRRVVVSGVLTFDGSGRVVQVKAATLKTLGPSPDVAAAIQAAQVRGEVADDPPRGMRGPDLSNHAVLRRETDGGELGG